MTHNNSRHFRTTHLLHAVVPLSLPHDTQIRLMSAEEAGKLLALVRKNNVFARHASKENFYLERINGLVNQTIIETQRPGEPDQVIPDSISPQSGQHELPLCRQRLPYDVQLCTVRLELAHCASPNDPLRLVPSATPFEQSPGVIDLFKALKSTRHLSPASTDAGLRTCTRPA